MALPKSQKGDFSRFLDAGLGKVETQGWHQVEFR